MKYWYMLIGAYLVLHIGIMTNYTSLPAEHNEAVKWLFALQWFIPTFMLGLLIPRIQRLMNPIVRLRIWTTVGLVIVVTCVALYFTNALERWFAWPTLGLLTLLVLVVANSQTQLGNTNAWLLGAMVVLLALGSWEIIYQTGLWFYHGFFGYGIMSYYVIISEQFTWIIPALIVILILYQRGLRLDVSRIGLICIGVSIVCTTLWFASGMDVPFVFWQGPSGQESAINEAARPWVISVSRGSQGFWLLGIVSLFIKGGSRRVHSA